jgi:hypothetical protein
VIFVKRIHSRLLWSILIHITAVCLLGVFNGIQNGSSFESGYSRQETWRVVQLSSIKLQGSLSDASQCRNSYVARSYLSAGACRHMLQCAARSRASSWPDRSAGIADNWCGFMIIFVRYVPCITIVYRGNSMSYRCSWLSVLSSVAIDEFWCVQAFARLLKLNSAANVLKS